MNNFFKALSNNEMVYSENDATMYKTSGNSLVDLNFSIPKLNEYLSNKDYVSANKLFNKAFYDDMNHTLRWLLFVRDIRKGCGMRDIFKFFLISLDINHPDLMHKFLKLPLNEYGRWDDIIAIYNSLSHESKDIVIDIIKHQLDEDIKNMNDNKQISLLAKWMPSENTSSKNTRALARFMMDGLKLSPKQYRKTLSSLRKYLDIIETKISMKKYDEINYSSVPSKANLRYQQLFFKCDFDRYSQFLDNVSKGKQSINAQTLFVHDIIHKYRMKTNSGDFDIDQGLEELWKHQSITDNFQDTLIIRDGSYSMTISIPNFNISAADVADALTIFSSEHNSDDWKNMFITFSSHPSIVEFEENMTLKDKLNELEKYDDCSNTDIEGAFNLILNTAISKQLSSEDLPKNILIISDMEFDAGVCNQYRFTSLFDSIKQKFDSYGYKLPKLIFWNVNSRSGGIPIQENDNGVVLLSGFSQQLMSLACSDKLNPYDVLIEYLDSPRYDCVNECFK